MELDRERDLIERAKTSREAFGELYDANYRRIYLYCLKRTADTEVARDTTAAVFYEALTHIKGYQWRGVPYSHWLYRTANRKIINHFNRHKREAAANDVGGEGSGVPWDGLYSRDLERHSYEDYIDLQRCISRLPSRYQEVITLKYFEGMELKEIAGVLSRPEGTVKSLLHRGIEQLRKLMEVEEE